MKSLQCGVRYFQGTSETVGLSAHWLEVTVGPNTRSNCLHNITLKWNSWRISKRDRVTPCHLLKRARWLHWKWRRLLIASRLCSWLWSPLCLCIYRISSIRNSTFRRSIDTRLFEIRRFENSNDIRSLKIRLFPKDRGIAYTFEICRIGIPTVFIPDLSS